MIDIKQVKEQLKLSTVVSRYINLTYNKGLSWGLCPFHDEKHPPLLLMMRQVNIYATVVKNVVM